MGCPEGYSEGMTLEYSNDPRTHEEISDTGSVSEQHLSQLELKTGVESDDVEKESSDEVVGLIEKLSLSNVSVNSASVFGTSITSVTPSMLSNSVAPQQYPYQTLPLSSNTSFPMSSSAALWSPGGPYVYQQQFDQMKQYQQLLEQKEKERDQKMMLVEQQLKATQEDNLKLRNDAAAKSRLQRKVSFSTGGSASELNEQAAKLKAQAAKKQGKKHKNIGIDMDKIRDTPGLSNRVDGYMQSVNSIPSLSAGALDGAGL